MYKRQVLKKFHQIYPNIHVSVTELDSVPLENQISEGLLDIALIALPAVKLKENVDWLMRDEILMAAYRDHPIMEFVHPPEKYVPMAWVRLEDAAPFEFILGPPGTILGLSLIPI